MAARSPFAAMGRMHSHGKGMCSSVLPYRWDAPIWLKATAQDVEKMIVWAAKKGQLPSHINMLLREAHGVTGAKILRVLKARMLAPEMHGDLYFLIKKVVAMRKHLERNRKDKDMKFWLILVESRVHRLTKKIPASWKYESTTVSTLVA